MELNDACEQMFKKINSINFIPNGEHFQPKCMIYSQTIKSDLFATFKIYVSYIKALLDLFIIYIIGRTFW